MASLTRTSGVTITAAATPVQFYGRSLQFLAVVIKNNSATALDLSGEFLAEYAIDLVNQMITAGTGASGGPTGGSSILAIQYDATGQLSYILDGSVGNWTAGTLQTALRAMGATVGPNGIDLRGTTVTDVGYKLALS